MKNPLHSLLSHLFNFCVKLNRKAFLLLLFGALLFSNFSHAQLPLFDNFESGWGNWNDGGGDCDRLNSTIINGNRNVRLRDNSGGASSTFSDVIDLTPYTSVDFEFLFRANSMENGEDFFVEYDDGSGYITIANYVRGTDFNNGIVYTVSLNLPSTTYNFTANSRFRIRCDATANNDQIYVDDISITSPTPCSQPGNQPTSLVFSNISDDTIEGSFTAATALPDNYLVVYNTTGTTPSPVDGTTYNIGDSVGAGNIVADNDGDTSFSVTGLTSATTYYFFIYSFNDACTGGPDYRPQFPLTDNATTDSYCIPSSTGSSYYIQHFTTSGATDNISNLGSGFSAGGYGDFTSLFATQSAGSDINFNANFTGGTFGFAIWVDFNNDGDFTDTGEDVYLNGGYTDPLSDSFTIPAVTTAGSYRMRIVADWFDVTPSPCSITSNRGEAEDYTLNVTPQPPCSEPTDQPSNLTFNSTTETSMILNFDIVPSTADNFLVVYNTNGNIPVPVDTGIYVVGGNVGAGNFVIGNDTTTTYALTGLTDNTTYYFYVFAYNDECSGGPDYLSVNPLTGTNTTFEFCTTSTDPGTSLLGCLSVDAGGLGLNGLDVTINCSGPLTADLEASFLDLGDTSSYSVESIPYSPPYQFGCLANPVSVNVDDVWSDVINLPFDFCFYGNTYNSCVIGSNGVISFDTSLANSYSGWTITTDIPSVTNSDAGFFGPSIYGVHHDVDPSVGGEIGYQLITLDTGCRALVASWFQVPMYQNNSIIYTGMMVFYEDSNIIEVYIKEKNIDGTWNGGNGIIGLQADATTGTVVPNRNGLDTNWTVSEEAWRFVPSGSSIAELKWYENSVSVANEIIDPNNDGQITVTPSVNTTYIAEVTYDLCTGPDLVVTDATTVTITGQKIWNGSLSSNWNSPNNWTPNGVPDITNCIIIPDTANDPTLPGINGNGFNMEIRDGAILTQQPNSTLTIEDEIIIEPNGEYIVRRDASVIQINDVTINKNIGAANVQRQVTGLDNFDYVYWSSPVDAFDVEDISPGTPNFAIFDWRPTVANGTAGQHGTWFNTAEDMTPGKGYIVRGLIGNTIANTSEFKGVLNNGKISYPISRGTWTGADYAGIGNTATAQDDNWNLLGNPYPSAISLNDFVSANPTIDGTLYFWRHLNAVSSAIDDPFYEGYTYNYNDNDYIAANSMGSSPPGFNGYIASGQGFFAFMLDSAPTPGSVNFDNTMRGLYANNGFYRSASNTNNKHRIWLDLIGEDNTAISILVGFADGATDDLDRLYDGFSINQSENQFYSVLSDQKLTIQGKALPFEDSKTIPLGYISSNSGGYTITINQLDGLFENRNQNIYLEDKELNIIHDLRATPYTFTTESGTFNERFVLRFNNTTLSIKDEDIISEVRISSVNNKIDVTSPLSNIKTFELFDITGRTIYKNINVNSTNYNYETNNLSVGTYIVQVLLDNGAVVSKKIII